MSHRILSRATALSATVLVVTLAALAAGQDDRPALPVEVEGWSVWVVSPSQKAMNVAKVYPDAMPSVVGSSRPRGEARKSAAGFPIAPISIVRFFGEPAQDVDVELRLKSGTLLSHWPPGRERSGRVQWFKSDLLKSAPPELPPSHVPESHLFHKLRTEGDALYLRNESHAERLLAYDAELNLPVPVKIRGGPDEYTLQNLSGRRLRDVAVIAPTEAGFRVGWLDELPTAVPEPDRKAEEAEREARKKRSDAEKADEVIQQAEAKEVGEAEAPLPPEADAELRARVDQVLNRPVTASLEKVPWKEALDLIAAQARMRYELDEPALAKEKIEASKAVTLKAAGIAARDALAEVLGGLGLSYRVTDRGTLFITTAARLAAELDRSARPLEGPPIALTLSQPLKADNPSYRELTQDAYTRRLASQGLREASIRFLLDHIGQAIFEPGELIVLAHLSPEAIEEEAPVDVFPPPKKMVRTALVVIHGVDPRLQDRARALVEKLSDKVPKVREAAEKQLFELGPVAVPALEDALNHKDIEVVFRVERLLMRLNRPVP